MIAQVFRAGWLGWPVVLAVVLAHLGLAVLAVVELVRLGWLVSEPYELTAVTAVAASGGCALVGGLWAAGRAVASGRALHRLVRKTVEPLPPAIRAAAEQLEIAHLVDVVAGGEAFAVAYGWWRPRILVSTGLSGVLDPAELTAVLAHERHHVRRRDPLRLLAARVLAGYGWFLPLLRWWVGRSAVRTELTADRAATARVGVAAVAGALLKLADRPAPAAVAAINPAGNLPDRIAALERGGARRRAWPRWWIAGATVANLGGLAAATICCAGLGVAMTGGL